MPISAISAASRFSMAWFGLVLPSLLINYFGQGALVLVQSGGDRKPVLSCWCPKCCCCRWSCWRRSRP